MENKIIASNKSSILLSLALIFVLTVSSCTKKISFLTSPIVPAARGNVQVKVDKNKNHAIAVHLSQLAEVDRLQPPRQMYIVWMLTDQGVVKNLGQVTSSSNLMSPGLKGAFQTVTAFKPVKIFITAEDDANVQYPNNQVVLETAVFMK